LGLARNFLSLLAHSLSTQALLKEFLLLLRESLGLNRAAIFLRDPVSRTASGSTSQTRRLAAGYAVGLPADSLQNVDLSLEAGIGGALFRQARVLRRDSEEAQDDSLIQAEFEALGAEVAIPIVDRETLVGVAIFDGHLTGPGLGDAEVELLFHLLEDLGLAIRNTWTYDQLVANHEMLVDVLRQLDMACVVIGSDLSVRHANRAAITYFGRAGKRSTSLDFGDLPEFLGAKVFQVFKTAAGITTFKYSPPDSPTTVYAVTILPLSQGASTPDLVVLLVDNRTQAEQLQRLEIEATNLRLIKSMAERLAHEIGNAVVPLATHEQLLSQKYDDPEFRDSLAQALGESVKRISRLARQMFFLARDTFERADQVPIKQLVEEAFQEAQRFHSGKVARLHFENGASPFALAVDHAGLRHALSEVILNALQANASDSRVTVSTRGKKAQGGEEWVDIEIRDAGPGFSTAEASQALNPFFTSRSVGIGLGLTVARRIVEKHRGRIEITPSGKEQPSQVIISLPAA
jgi:nitrogen-specific signal transduction histidine kinase